MSPSALSEAGEVPARSPPEDPHAASASAARIAMGRARTRASCRIGSRCDRLARGMVGRGGQRLRALPLRNGLAALTRARRERHRTDAGSLALIRMSLILMPAPFDLPFVQRAVLEVALLSVGAGLLGTWIVLRGLSFYAHAVGTAAFPGLVLADGVGFSASLGAFATAGVVALLVAMLARRGESSDAATALVLAAALAAGVILASDVFHSQASVERLLFGSLLLVDTRDHLLAAAMSLSAVAAGAVLGHRWLAAGFDPGAARALGARSPVPDVVLLLLIGFGAIAVLDAVGALLATALLVVPAATTRLVVDRLVPWQLATIALALAEGVAGVWLAVETNAPPGATVAVIGAG